MEADPSCFPAISLHLSRVLDEIGLNSLTVRKRRHLYLFLEQLDTIKEQLSGEGLPSYHFGSQTEGATTAGLKSDLDTLYYSQSVNVIEDWSNWHLGKINLLMLGLGTAPGYCRLQLLGEYVPMAVKEVPNCECIYDSDGRVIIKNTWLNTPNAKFEEVRNGPARSQRGPAGFLDEDYVTALYCKFWPTHAEEFIRRHRRHGWPSQNLLRKAVTHGVFLVPVGYKLSTTEHLEWRISASLTERCLMFSLNTVHIKCYVVLKMLVKTFIEPLEKKCISSYHCKTALLHSVENTPRAFWRDNNLLQCVKQCLTLLHAWVTGGVCPHFVIAEENLFAGKVTVGNKILLQSILKDLITRTVRALLHVHIDDLGRKLHDKRFTTPSVVPVLDSLESLRLITEFEYIKHVLTNFKIKVILLDAINTQLVPIIRSVCRTIAICKSCVRHSENHERQATNVYIEIFSRWLGSLLASFSLSHETRVPRIAIQLLRIGEEYDVASMLKLASVFYSNGDFRKAELILCEVEKHACSNKMQSACCCYDKSRPFTHEFVRNVFLQRGSRARCQLFAHCLRFSPQEIHCTPPALRNEFFRSVGDDFQHRVGQDNEWMDFAAVDCLPCLYYIQYMTYTQLGKRDLQRQSIHNLDRCLRERQAFGHPETGWNLLGQCKELEQEPEAALTCYRQSLEIRRRNNAANLHVAILCYKVIKSHN